MVKLDLQSAQKELIRWTKDPSWIVDLDVEALFNGEIDSDDYDLKDVEVDEFHDLVHFIKKGRIVLEDSEDGSIKVVQNLLKPILMDDNKCISCFTLHELDVGSIRKSAKGNPSATEQGLSLVAQLTGQTGAMVNRMLGKDFAISALVMRVFFQA